MAGTGIATVLVDRALRIRSDGATLTVQITATALLKDAGRMYAIATTERPQPAACSVQRRAA